MTSDEQIELCAQIADAMLAELETQKKTAKKEKYDRRTNLEIDYAIRAVRRVALRIRALKSVASESGPAGQ